MSARDIRNCREYRLYRFIRLFFLAILRGRISIVEELYLYPVGEWRIRYTVSLPTGESYLASSQSDILRCMLDLIPAECRYAVLDRALKRSGNKSLHDGIFKTLDFIPPYVFLEIR
jgi:hypothetical protein